MRQLKLDKLIRPVLICNRKYSSNTPEKKTKWESVIGLEVHAQINSKSKLFSTAATTFDTPPNRNVVLLDCGVPGTLPVLNKRCVEAGVMTALALNCKINAVSMFDRKHYFYPDMPAGYQITQKTVPLAVSGLLEFQVQPSSKCVGENKRAARIKQLQLEQDSGRSLHAGNYSLIDLNRAGIGLMEIVFEPDLRTSEEAAALVKELCLILKSLKTCNCKMEEGEVRVDVNVSVRKPGKPFGVRTEIKNVCSIRGVANAIDYEVKRQIDNLEHGEDVKNETRAWDALSKVTLPMRDKEEKTDYRYMHEPNLPLLHVAVGPVLQGTVNAEEVKRKLPPLPEEKRAVLRSTYALTAEQAYILVNESSLYNIFMHAAEAKTVDTQLLAKILINDFLREVNERKLDLDKLELEANYFTEIVEIVKSGLINRSIVKEVLNEFLCGNSKPPSLLVKEKNWMQIADEDVLCDICRAVIEENGKTVEDYKAGKKKVFKALLGAVAAKTSQRADMAKCTKILQDLLKSVK